MTYAETVETTSWVVFEISNDYKWTLFVTMLMIVHYFTCVIGAGSPRKDLFPEDWMEEHFGKEHSEALNGAKIGKGGYPDCGSGRYTMERGYGSWMKFMKAQRGHYNYLESVSQILTMMLTCGLYYPIATAVIGAVYMVGRIIFQVGYKIAPQTRMLGVPIVMLTQFGLPIFTIVSLSHLASSSKAIGAM